MVSKRNINRKKTVKKVIKVKPKLPEKPIVEDNPKEEFRKEQIKTESDSEKVGSETEQIKIDSEKIKLVETMEEEEAELK